jgi:hypothetical protein
LNQVLFNGETRIQPEQFEEYGTDESITYKIKENIFSIKRNRDSMKLYQNGTVFSFFGMEDQMNVRFEQKYLSLSKFQITEQDMR